MSKRDHETGELIRGDADLKAKLDRLTDAANEVRSQLEAASQLRVGAVDTNARAVEINHAVREVMQSCCTRLKTAMET